VVTCTYHVCKKAIWFQLFSSSSNTGQYCLRTKTPWFRGGDCSILRYKYYIAKFRVSGFVNSNLLLVPFSLSSSLGAGSDKRTQKPLGANQESQSQLLLLWRRRTTRVRTEKKYTRYFRNKLVLDAMHLGTAKQRCSNETTGRWKRLH
jgi:hypothetical protein